ncbi:MAG: LacI family DNA-binding transcriptional regulator [Planctomycetota bacterium]
MFGTGSKLDQSTAVADAWEERFLHAIGKDEYPSRRAVVVLRDRVRRFLETSEPKQGERFPTDEELVAASGLSRSTVRRALGDLHDAGWICRQPGRGSFVGPRVTGAAAPETEAVVDTSNASDRAVDARLARVAVLISNVGDLAYDWFAPEVLGGIESVAEELGIRTEIIGQRKFDIDELERRLRRGRPDVLLAMPFGESAGLVPRDTGRLGIPLLVTSELFRPCVVADNRQAMAMAVRRLADAGHRRIGLILNEEGWPWTVARCRSYTESLALHRVDTDSRLLHWSDVAHTHMRDLEPTTLTDQTDRLLRYLDEVRPDAIIASSSPISRLLSIAVNQAGLRVPDDLSVISFDQNPLVDAWFGMSMTTVELPLREMGRRLAEMARRLHEGLDVPDRTLLSCTLREGSSIRDVNASGESDRDAPGPS